LSFPQDLDRWENDRILKSALNVSLFIYIIVGIVFVGVCFLAVYVNVSKCARNVCVCVCVCEFPIDFGVVEYEY
jgi:hypothetical protein